MSQSYNDYFDLHAKCSAQNGSPISWADAVALQNEITALSSLELEYLDDMCGTRCHLIQELLHERGAEFGSLMIHFNDEHKWEYHFAAYAILDTGQHVIFDPMHFKDPITKEAWVAKWENDHPDNYAIVVPGFMESKPATHSLGKLQDYAAQERQLSLEAAA